MNQLRLELELVGPRAGQTVRLNGHQFVNGVCTLQGTPDSLHGALRYLGRSYNAFPRGSTELQEAKRRYEEALYGDRREGTPDAEHRPADEHQDHPGASRGPAETGESVSVKPDVGTEAGDAGLLSGRDGHQDTGLSVESGTRGGGSASAQESRPDLSETAIGRALLTLDPDDDAHWTAGGRPKLSVIENLSGNAGVTRGDVNEASPGFDREAARKLRGQVDEIL